MRRIAGAVLAGMAALFMLAAVGRRLLPVAGVGEALGWVQAFAEAGLAGGLADWFAVTALFRRPLGLPIPHTAIIPQNRDRIGRALGAFITGQLVTPALVERALERFDAAALLPGLIARTPRPELERMLAAALRAGLDAAPVAPAAGAVLARIWTPERSGVLVRRAVRLLARTLESRHDELRDTLVSHGTGWTPRFVDRMLADRVLAALGGVLTDLEAPTHPWRSELDRLVLRLAGRLADDPALATQGERWKAELLAGDAVATLARALAERLAGDPPALDADSAAALNRIVRAGLRDRILAERPALADLISARMKDWDEATMVSELELQAGRDLQYIRINGAVVGGIAGLAIHGVLKLIGG
jgi:uncharacterized membrane-anchored protein YjiN (DUF445 family)